MGRWVWVVGAGTEVGGDKRAIRHVGERRHWTPTALVGAPPLPDHRNPNPHDAS